MDRARRHPAWLVAGLAVLVAVPYAVLGVGFVLDDWWSLRNAHFEGALHADGYLWIYRPGQAVVYWLTFGLVGQHPLALYLVQVAISAVTAVLLYHLMRRVLEPGPALAVAAVWAVLPNHASLVNWASASSAAVALLLLLAGSLLLTSPRPRVATEVGAALLLGMSVVTYEATGPAAALAALFLPRIVSREWRWRSVALAVGGVAAAGLWMVTHINPLKQGIDGGADFAQLFPAHFGWGVAPRLLAPVTGGLALVALVRTFLGVSRFRGRRLMPEDRLVLAGLAVVVLGTIPFVKYFYAPLGAGDRANVVAAVGTALAWTGVGWMAWKARRELAIAGGAVVAGSMLLAGVTGARAWHAAAQSGRSVVAALPSHAVAGEVVVGPRPLQVRNVAAFLDRSNIEAAVQLKARDPLAAGRISWTEPDFDSIPPDRRIDLRCLPGTLESARQECPA